MCTFGPMVQGILGGIGTLVGASASASAAKSQIKGAVTAMNFNLQNLEQQRRDAYDAAVNEIMENQMSSRRLQGSVEAATATDLPGGGRTADLIRRSVKADELRATGSIKDNYARQSDEINLNREAVAKNTQAQTKAIAKSTKYNNLTTLLGLANTGVTAWNQHSTLQNEAKAKGYKLDKYGRATF